MVRKCKFIEGCSKSARSKSDLCIEHGGGKRCTIQGCSKSARSKSDLCVEHGGGKRCTIQGCSKSAEGKTDFCVGHGGGKRCTIQGCSKSARGKSDLCIEHGGGKRCTIQGCSKSAVGKSDLCVEHGGGKRCPNCIEWPDSRCGCKKYDGYCATCFKHIFPTDERSTVLRVKSHEILVRNYLNEHINGFIHDRPLYTGHCDCTHRRRIDHRMIIGNTVLAVETDERQHRNYDSKDEEDRYDDLYMVHSGKWVFIRFNPDSYINNKWVRINPDVKKRLPILLKEIIYQIERIKNYENNELVETVKLYFDYYN